MWSEKPQVNIRLGWLFTLLTILIVAFWAFWGLQLKMHPENFSSQAYNEKQANMQAMVRFLGPIQSRANKLYRDYGPKQFYADRKAIELKERELKYPISLSSSSSVAANTIRYLLEKSEANVQLHPEWARDDFRERSIYVKWHMKTFPDSIYNGAVTLWLKKVGWLSVAVWLLVFYLRSMLMAVPLYLVRMKQRKGVLATILADKTAFTLAVVFWPVGLFRYPYNIVREIRVEAELRRLGKALRWLTPAEKQTVHEVAASAHYHEWLRNYHARHQFAFRRSLLTAIATTLLIQLLSISLLASPIVIAPFGRDSRTMTIAPRDGPTIHSVLNVSNGNVQDTGGVTAAFLNDFRPNAPSNGGGWIIQIDRKHVPIARAEKIEHVPLIDHLVSVFQIQMVGGSFLRQRINGGYHEKRNRVRSCSNRAVTEFVYVS